MNKGKKERKNEYMKERMFSNIVHLLVFCFLVHLYSVVF